MSDFWSQIKSPSWWLGVVIVGLLINLISAYVKPPLDKGLGFLFNWWSTRNKSLRDNQTALVERIKTDSQEQNIFIAHEIRYRLKSTDSLLLAVLSYVVVFYLSYKRQSGLHDGLLPLSLAAREQFYSVGLKFLHFVGALSLMQAVTRRKQAAVVNNLLRASRGEKIDTTLEFFE